MCAVSGAHPEHNKGDKEFLTILEAVHHYDSENVGNRLFVTNFLFHHRGQQEALMDHFFLFNKSERAIEFNLARLNEVPGQVFTFQAVDGLGENQTERQQRVNEMQTGLPTTLSVKVGCRVMCQSNVHHAVGVVNGALGTVRAIHRGAAGDYGSIIQVGFDGGSLVNMSQEQMTVHGKNFGRLHQPLRLVLPKSVLRRHERVRRAVDFCCIDFTSNINNLLWSYHSMSVPQEVRLHMDPIKEGQWCEHHAAWLQERLQLPIISASASSSSSLSQQCDMDEQVWEEFHVVADLDPEGYLQEIQGEYDYSEGYDENDEQDFVNEDISQI
ncbi:hypothetical protein BGX26_002354 [Mortierella sp. AD094]|nr:hypothetical protein BGX26_002354 [Mortierella sp. AD094]